MQPTPILTPPYDPIGDDAHTDRDERTAVVAWLRREAARPAYSYDSIGRGALRDAADAIEQGRHHTDPETT